MGLSADSMKDKIIDELGGLNGSEDQKNKAEKYILAICKGIVKEIQDNAVVHTIDSDKDTCDNGTIE